MLKCQFKIKNQYSQLLQRLNELIEANYEDPLMNLAGNIDVHGNCKDDQNVADGFQDLIIINDDEIDSEESGEEGSTSFTRRLSVRGQFP